MPLWTNEVGSLFLSRHAEQAQGAITYETVHVPNRRRATRDTTWSRKIGDGRALASIGP